ncbi:hypothetical protein N7474_002744 [Penicillium riverlandense]|uniref:uncharacterized protein n=1 Tax=Penicillium riverlandense TaxID=1903569 RepID=UPI002548C2EF|nr:uncharacterized protein N7474_002744 [Penicillium riverlandense]KAJ5825606.1 hypothetical protein N7474_002744 [Penicillium riverlandense]
MPPPLEDLESDDEDLGDIPHGGPEAKSEESEENGEEEDEEDGLYVVEDILDHKFVKGELELLVKWKGYEEPEDQTFEPEEGLLEGAHDIVAEYYRRIGGRPQPPPKPAKGPGRKRKSMTDAKPAPSLTSPLSPTKRRKRSPREAEERAKKEEGSEESDLNWVPKAKNWEKQVDSVDTIVRDPDTDTLFAFLKWTNGKQTKVSIQSCYENCPQKMLKFYESHLYVLNPLELGDELLTFST